jgi:hypothetical protein
MKGTEAGFSLPDTPMAVYEVVLSTFYEHETKLDTRSSNFLPSGKNSVTPTSVDLQSYDRELQHQKRKFLQRHG